MNTCSPWKHEVKNLSLVLNSLQSWRHDGPDDRDTVKGYSRVIFKDGNDSVHLCSVDYSASVGSVETWRAVSGWARAPSAVTQWWALWPTIDVQLCGVISCLVLRVWWTGRKPPSCLCHLKNRNDWQAWMHLISTCNIHTAERNTNNMTVCYFSDGVLKAVWPKCQCKCLKCQW